MSAAASSDADLVQHCLRGKTAAFQVLYQRYQRPVRGTLFQLCGAAELDDLVQEVFLRVWKGLPKFRQSAQFSTWLYRIVCNVATDRRRTLGKARSQPPLTAPVPRTDQSELTRLHYEDLVQRGLQALSWHHRTVLVLHDLEDLPQQEVASILNIPKGTVKSRLHHARSALRTFLQQEGVQL